MDLSGRPRIHQTARSTPRAAKMGQSSYGRRARSHMVCGAEQRTPFGGNMDTDWISRHCQEHLNAGNCPIRPIQQAIWPESQWEQREDNDEFGRHTKATRKRPSDIARSSVHWCPSKLYVCHFAISAAQNSDSPKLGSTSPALLTCFHGSSLAHDWLLTWASRARGPSSLGWPPDLMRETSKPPAKKRE